MREAFRRRERPKTLLSAPSPYGSCQLIVETDRVVTAAYLLDPPGRVRSSLWLANHVPAPHRLDQDRIQDGLLPPMPAGHTKHREGRSRPRRRSLGVLWFHEGDGAIVTEDGEPLGVLPGWPDGTSGAPGYSRDALGHTPLAWTMDGEEAVWTRIAMARVFWRWQTGGDNWSQYQQTVLSHLDRGLGQGGRYWNVDGDQLPRVGVVEHPRGGGRSFTVHSTVGMSCQRMPYPDGSVAPPSERIELAVATSRPYEPTVDLLAWLGQHPWRSRTRFEPGHCLAGDTDGGRFPLGERWRGVLMLADPGALLGPPAPDLSGLTAGGDAVRWLWLVPVTDRQYAMAAAHGGDTLLDELRLSGHTWVADV